MAFEKSVLIGVIIVVIALVILFYVFIVQKLLFGIVLVYEGNRTTTYCKNWFFKGETATLIFRVTNPYFTKLSLNFYLVPLDSYNKNVSYLVYSTTIPGAFIFPSTKDIKLNIDTNELNECLYVVKIKAKEISLELNGSKQSFQYNFESYPWMLAVISNFRTSDFSFAKAYDLVVPYGLGVNIHFINPNEQQRFWLDMMKYAGFKLIRMDFIWDHVERSKGVYDFSDYVVLTEELKRRGIAPLYILDYGNPLYDNGLSPHTEEGRVAFANFAANATKKFLNYDIIWEIWNEPNIGFWKPSPNVNDYSKLAIETAKKVRSVNKDALVIAPASAGIDLNFMRSFIEYNALNYVSAVSVHPYRDSSPETVTDDYAKLRQLVNNKTIVSSEWGYTTSGSYGNKVDILTQAKYLTRMYLVNLMNRVPITIMYDWKDDGTDPSNSENSFGMIANEQISLLFLGRESYFIKPAYYAVYNLAKNLNGFKFLERVDIENDSSIYLLKFSNGLEQKFVIWTTSHNEKEVTLNLTKMNVTNATKVELIKMFGESKVVNVTGNFLKIGIDDAPTIISFFKQ
ncbi:MAG: cellulase family glycosylhydrolase [Thermoproteota archaeon]